MARGRADGTRTVIVFPALAVIAAVIGLTVLLFRMRHPSRLFLRRRHGRITEDELSRVWERHPGLVGWLSAVNNDHIGTIFLASTFLFFILSGLDSVALRTQLIVPDAEIIEPDKFNQLFTTHGTAMMFLFAVPMLEALALYALP